MNNLRNKVNLIGRLGSNPEVKELSKENSLVKFSLATNDNYTDSNGTKVSNTEWHNIVAWGKTAKNMEKLLQKGSEIAIEGKLQYKNYEDNKGVKRYYTEILCHEFIALNNLKDKE